jgi:Peptidase family M1 domain
VAAALSHRVPIATVKRVKRLALAAITLLFIMVAVHAAWPSTSPERKLYTDLNALRVDPARVYHIRRLALRRDSVRLAFEEGTLGLLEPLQGRVLGAVFSGKARVLATPRDPAEKQSIARFLGVPLVDTTVTQAYLRFTDDTGAELESFLRASGAKPEEDSKFLAEWNALVASLNTVNSVRTLRDLQSTLPLPYFRATLGGSEQGTFEVSVDDRRREQILLGQVKYREGGRFYNLWAMFPRQGGPGEPAIAAPLRYGLNTTLDESLAMHSRANISLRLLRSGERILPLALSRELRVESVADAAGQNLEFFQNEDMSEQEIQHHGDDVFYVVLPQPTQAGQDLPLQVTFSGTVISSAGNGVYYTGERGAWYPRPEDSESFCPFELDFRWPRKLDLVATGNKTAEGEDGAWRTGHWTSDSPLATAGFNLGIFTRTTAEAGTVRVGVNANQQLEEALYRLFRSRPTIPAGPSLQAPFGPLGWARTSDAWKSIDMSLPTPSTVPPLPAAVLAQLAKDISDAILGLEQWNGPFPFPRMEVSPLPAAMGQSWPELMYLSTLSFLPKETQVRAGVSVRTRFSFSDLMPFHELAHQWWGNVAGASTYRDDWILEGLANYCALMYIDTRIPPERTLAQVMQDYREDMLAKIPDDTRITDDIGPLALGERLTSSVAPNGYNRLVYPKATWVVHMLRMMLQTPGAKDPDARFRGLLRTLLDQYRFKNLTEADLRREVNRIMTPEMGLEGMHSVDWFFEQWVHSTGIPRYSVEFKTAAGPKGFVVEGVLHQEGVPETFLARVPLYAPGAAGRRALLGWVVTNGGKTTFRFTSAARPDRILIDPNQTLLTAMQ